MVAAGAAGGCCARAGRSCSATRSSGALRCWPARCGRRWGWPFSLIVWLLGGGDAGWELIVISIVGYYLSTFLAVSVGVALVAGTNDLLANDLPHAARARAR